MPYLNKDSEAYIIEFYTSDEFQGELSKSEVVDFKKKLRTERQSGTLFLILGFSLVFVSPIVFNDFNICFSIFLIGFLLSVYGIVIHDQPVKKIRKENDTFEGTTVNYRFETVLDGIKIKGKRINSIEMQMIEQLHMDYPLLMRVFDKKKWFLYKDQTWITDSHYEQSELVVFPASKDSGQKEKVAVIGKYKTKEELEKNTSNLENAKTFVWSNELKKVLDGDEEKEDPVQKITPKITDNMNFIKNYIEKLNENTTELRGEEIITETQSRNLIKFTEFNGKMGEAARELGYKRPKSLRENLKIISSKTGELYRIINSIKNKENLQDKYELPKHIDEIYPKVVTKETTVKIGSATAKMWEEEAGSQNTLNEEAKKVNDEELYEILADFPSYSESDGTLEIKRTWLETLLLHNKGLTIEEIAKERNLTKETIAKHLTILVKMKIIKDFKNLTEEKNYQIMLKYIQSNYSKSSFSPFSIYDDEDPAKTPHYGFIDLFLAINESKKEGFPNNKNFRTYDKIISIYQDDKLDRDQKIFLLEKIKISSKEIGSLVGCASITVEKVLKQQKEEKDNYLDKDKKERINANIKFINDHISDHVEFGKVSSLINNLNNDELMPKFVLNPSQLKRLLLVTKNNGNLTRTSGELGISKNTLRKSIRALKEKHEIYALIAEKILRSSDYLEKDDKIISLLKEHYNSNRKDENWENNVLNCIKLLIKDMDDSIFTRKEFLDEFIGKFKKDYPRSKTPEQTISRVFQDLIRKEKLSRISSGVYELMPLFTIHKEYSREDVKKILGINVKRGPYERGYWEHKESGDMFVFANVGIPGVTGHDYNNYWDNDLLRWEGDTRSTIDSGRIKLLIDQEVDSHIFTRETKKGLFTYEGIGIAQDVKDTLPVQISWAFEVMMPENDGEIVKEKSHISKDLERKYKLMEKYWNERDSLMKEVPDISLSKIFNYIEFCVLEEGVALSRERLIKWFRETQQGTEHPIELTYQNNMIAYSKIPYKEILENGMPKSASEAVIDYFDKNSGATPKEISNATEVKIESVRKILTREGLIAAETKGTKENLILEFIRNNPGCSPEVVLNSINVSKSYLTRVVKKHNVISSSDFGLTTLRINEPVSVDITTEDETNIIESGRDEELAILWTPKYGLVDILSNYQKEVLVGVSFPVDSDLLKLPCVCYVNEEETGVRLKLMLNEIIRFGRPSIPEDSDLLIEEFENRKFVTFFRVNQIEVLDNEIPISHFKKKDGKTVTNARNYTIILA